MNNPTAAHPWQTTPDKITSVITEETCDIVVIGAGIAGCAAAEAASREGASVICCEKFGTFTAHGIDVGSVGTRIQKESGINIDSALAARLIYEWGQQQANYHLIRTYTERSGKVLDYFIDMAERAGLRVYINDEMTARIDWDTLDDKYKMFQSAHVFELTDSCKLKKRKWNVSYLVETIYNTARENGVEFRHNTKVEQLVTDDGAVTGVITSDEEGFRKISARRGVIIATGGIADNDEMLRCWCPAALRTDLRENFPVGGNMGDGILLGVWAGAAITRCNPAPIIHPVNFSVLSPGMNTSWLTVNRDGQRFSSEVAYEPAVTNARMNAPGNIAYAIWDSDYKAHVKRQEPHKATAILDGVDEKVEREVESGAYIRAETLSELADKIGVPQDALEKTVARYNKWCDDGADGDFGVPRRFLSSVKKGPFYATKISAFLLALPHGLHVDQNSQVLTEQDEPVEGLFAVGNAQGDFFANSYPVTLPGTSHGRCLTFGHLVGKALARGEKINGYNIPD